MEARDAGTERTRAVWLGTALVALYVVVAAATGSWAPGRMRPLFDGFGSHPGQYNWVAPPKEFAEGNQEPEPSEVQMKFDAAGSEKISTGPKDGQALVTLVAGAVAAHAGDTTATVTIAPVDPAKLGPLPAGLRPEGNAYRVAIDRQPSGAKVVALEKPSSVGLTSAAPADTLLFSLDGKAWKTEQGQPLPSGKGITGPLTSAGYVLAASKGPLREAGPASGSGSGGGIKGVLIMGALAVPVVLGWLLLSRRRPAEGGRDKGGAVKAQPGGGRPAHGRQPADKASPKPTATAKGGGGGKSGRGGRGTGKGGKGPASGRR